MSWSTDCNAVTRFQEDVARMAAGLWRDQTRANNTSTTLEPATADTPEEIVENETAAIGHVRIDEDRSNEIGNDERGIGDEVQLLRETVQDLQTNIVQLRERQDQIQADLLTSSEHYLTAIQAIDSEKDALIANVEEFHCAEESTLQPTQISTIR